MNTHPIVKFSYSADGETWHDFEPSDTIVCEIHGVEKVSNESFSIKSFTHTFNLGWMPFYCVKAALDCMRYWLNEMAGMETGVN